MHHGKIDLDKTLGLPVTHISNRKNAIGNVFHVVRLRCEFDAFHCLKPYLRYKKNTSRALEACFS